MDQNRSGQPSNQGNQGGGSRANRPDVLSRLTPTQLDALELQFNEQDRQEWNTFTDSYGWSKQESDEVWQWFSQVPQGGESTSKLEGFPGEGR
ncbi:MAG TPA: hypothetical protein VFM49_18730 [Chloroflexia bacterium]|jgi:hypothetical protein|nr:hypothetical protein [Chloroflexia bacterium]